MYGHVEGDNALVKVAEVVKENIDGGKDFLARYGGEEFIIVSMNRSNDEMKSFGERIREKVRIKKIEHKDSIIDSVLTVSVGVASTLTREQISFEVLLKRADEALYKAKANGRNRVGFFE